MKPSELTRRVVQGYAKVLRSAAEALAILAGMVGAAFCIAYPVWWLATNRRGLYTALVLGGFAVVVGTMGIRRVAAGKGSRRGTDRRFQFRAWLFRCLFLAGAYGTAVLTMRSVPLGVAAAVVLLALVGIWTFGHGKPTSRGQ